MTFVIKSLSILILAQSLMIKAEWIDHKFPVMGTEVQIRFYLENKDKALFAKQAVIDEMHRINQSMSPYLESSELSKVNRLAASEAVKISKELFDLLKRSNDISKLTEGAFDITFRSIGYLYDYRARLKPSQKELSDKLQAVNYKALQFDETQQTVRFLKKDIKIDLGGIAKGHAVDNSIKILKQLGVKEASVTAGGDTYVLGNNNGKMWNVGIRHPRAESKLVSILPLADTAVSTSGDYERFFIENGERVHHILNPKTGQSANEVQSVTILTNNSTYADALSTSVFVLGVKKGLELVERLNHVSAIIVDLQGKMFYSSDFQNLSE